MSLAQPFAIRLTQKQLDDLEAVAGADGLPRQEHIRRAIDIYTSAWRRQVERDHPRVVVTEPAPISDPKVVATSHADNPVTIARTPHHVGDRGQVAPNAAFAAPPAKPEFAAYPGASRPQRPPAPKIVRR